MKNPSLADKKINYKKIINILTKSPLHIVLIIICMIWILPSMGLFISSIRPANLIHTTGWWKAFQTPFQFTFENYIHVIKANNMGRSFLNTMLIAVPSTIFPILIAAYAAYAFSWMKFPGRDIIFIIIVGLLVVPLQMTLIPILRLFNRLNLTGTFFGIWMAHAAYGLPFAIYLLRNFIGDLPGEMIESASMDGANNLQIFMSLILPTSIPAIASLSIFQFLWVWNDLLIALIYLGGNPSVAPMTLTISNLVNSYGGGWEYLTAAAFISMIVPLVLFFSLQRYFVTGILAGSVKE